MTQHHFGRQDQRAGVDLVLTGILGCRAVSGLEHGHGIGQVGARRDADAAHLGRQRVGDVVPVEVQRGDDAVFRRTQQNLLQESVGDHIFDDDLAARFRVLEAAPRPAVDFGGAELLFRQLVAPLLEGALGKLHDVALVHQGDRIPVLINGVLDRLAHQPLGAFFRHGLDADAGRLREADLGHPHLVLQEVDHFLHFRRAGLPLDAGVDVLGVLAEDDHVHQLRMLHRRRRAVEIAHRTLTYIEIQVLAQRHVERADATTDRRGQRPFDGHHILFHRLQRLVGQPHIRAINLRRLLAGVDLHPGDTALAAECLVHGGIHHLPHHRRDVHADAVPFDEGHDRTVRHVQAAVCIDGNLLTLGGHHDLLERHASTSLLK